MPPRTRQLRALADQITGALAVISDVASELGTYVAELPSDASTLELKLARQGELRTLTRKYAPDIDGVLQWAEQSRERLTQLDVSEEALADLERRVAELQDQVVVAATELTKSRTKAAKGLSKAVTAELSGLAMADAEFTVSVTPLPARADDSAPLTLPSGATRSRRSRRRRRRRVRVRGAPRHRCAAAEQERVGR